MSFVTTIRSVLEVQKTKTTANVKSTCKYLEYGDTYNRHGVIPQLRDCNGAKNSSP
jgi:hypothetical protein